MSSCRSQDFDAEDTKPYDYFSIQANLNWQKDQPVLGQINIIASFFRLIAFSGSAGYNFQTSPYSRHSLTVFKLTYNKLLHTTEAFDKTMPATFLSVSMTIWLWSTAWFTPS